LEKIKKAAAERWVSAVNADGKFGQWVYRLTKAPTEIPGILGELVSK
jgi:type III restriction enzyme